MVKRENLGFAFMAVGMVIVFMAIAFIPLKAPPVIVEVSTPAKSKLVAEPALSPQEHVLVAAYRHGWTGAQWDCIVRIVNLENPGWLPLRKNPKSTASGIFQVLRSASGRWFRDYSVADQARLGAKYIAHRYQNPCTALRFHLANGYF